jgi:thioredoxin 1
LQLDWVERGQSDDERRRAMNGIRELDDGNYRSALGRGLTLVDFWAPWCGPCMMQGPILEQVADQMGDRAAIAKMNVDENPNAAEEFSIRSIPTLIVFRDGAPLERFTGVQQERTLLSALKQHMAQA